MTSTLCACCREPFTPTRSDAKAARAGQATVVALLPSRTGARWWHDYIQDKDVVEIRFLPGRVKYVGADNRAPFDNAIVVFHLPSRFLGLPKFGKSGLARRDARPGFDFPGIRGPGRLNRPQHVSGEPSIYISTYLMISPSVRRELFLGFAAAFNPASIIRAAV